MSRNNSAETDESLANDSRRSRRWFLGAGAAAAVTAATGLATGSDDDGDPTLTQTEAHPLGQAETIQAVLAGKDADGLREATAATSLESASRRLPGSKGGSLRATLDGEPMSMNEVSFALTDEAGNTTTATTESYARKYDVLEETPVNVGAAYPNFVENKWNCLGVEADPAIGQWDLSSARDVNAHVDQMQGFGVTSMMVNYNGTPGSEYRFKEMLDYDLVSDIDLEVNFISSRPWQWRNKETTTFREALEADFQFFRDYVLSQDNYKTVADGRPLVTFYKAGYLVWNRDSRSYIKDEWGGYEGFLEWIHDELTVDGKRPYLVAGTPNVVGVGWSEFQQYFQYFDAVTTWVGVNRFNREGIDTWEEVLADREADFAATREYADEHDIGFVPSVFPGFDDRANSCWGNDRYLTRSVEGFRALLDLAAEYRTPIPNKVSIATWCDWTEGTQIEPGSFRGTDYGTDYVEAVRDFQQGLADE